MISKIYPLEQKLIFATKQGNAWRLRRAEATTPKEKDTINLIISLIEEDKDNLRKKLQEIENAQ